MGLDIVDIIKDTVFCILGVVLGLIFTPKDSHQAVSNGSTIQQTLLFIQQKVIIERTRTTTKKSESSTDDEKATIGLVIFGMVILAFLFMKYHSVILSYFVGFIFFAFALTATVAIQLFRNNNYDNLNRFWTVVSLVIIFVDVITLNLMDKQVSNYINTSTLSNFIETAGLNEIAKYAYYALGFLIIIIPNLLLIILQVHMLAVNSFLAKQGRIAAFIIRKTSPLVIKPIHLSIATVIVCILSLLFTSGIMYEFVERQQTALKQLSQEK